MTSPRCEQTTEKGCRSGHLSPVTAEGEVGKSVAGSESPNNNPEGDEAKRRVGKRFPIQLGGPRDYIVSKGTRRIVGQDQRVFNHGARR
jgi:hypothetical protein